MNNCESGWDMPETWVAADLVPATRLSSRYTRIFPVYHQQYYTFQSLSFYKDPDFPFRVVDTDRD